jgi:hypothetical protein
MRLVAAYVGHVVRSIDARLVLVYSIMVTKSLICISVTQLVPVPSKSKTMHYTVCWLQLAL